jgi:hypothetical protein
MFNLNCLDATLQQSYHRKEEKIVEFILRNKKGIKKKDRVNNRDF